MAPPRRFSIPDMFKTSLGGDAVRVSALYASLFCIIGLYAPFWPLVLKDRGLGPAEIGIIYGVGLLLRPLTAPAVGFIADRYLGIRRTLIYFAVATFVVFVIFWPASSFFWILLLNCLLLAVWTPMMPLTEALALKHQDLGKFSYGRVRVWGSVAFVCVNLLGGLLLTKAGVAGIYAAILVFSIAVVGITILQSKPPAAASDTQRPSLRGVFGVLSQPFVLLALIAAGMVDGSHAAYYGFASLGWRAQGVSDQMIGVLWASGVVAEVALLWFAGPWLRRQSGLLFIALGGVASIVRWALMAVDPPIWGLLIIQNLHALTFGATLLGVMSFIARNVPQTYAGSVQGLYSAMASGIFMAGASIASGQLFERLGSSAYWAVAAMGAGGALLALSLWWYRQTYGVRLRD